MRQDRQGVRTAQDLERKYKLSEMRKAFEQSEKSITRINQIIQDFVNTIVGTLDNFEGLADGYLTTHYGNGEPTIEESWTDGYVNHVNDLYYDRDNGKAYEFTSDFEWVEVIDESKIKALAMANATVDTKDSQRRIFVEQPIPPYDNGDLWLKDGVIYACQVTKPSGETFDKLDFILSSQYNGDTLAIKVGTELEVLRGTVLKVIEDAEFLRVEVNDLDNETTSSIELLKNALATLITDENGQSMMKQKGDGWVFEMKSILETIDSTSTKVSDLESEASNTSTELSNLDKVVKSLEEKTTYVNIGSQNGQPTIELGAKDSDFKVIITNTEIQFRIGNDVPAYINNTSMTIKDAKIEHSLQIGNAMWVVRGNNHISFM